MTSLRKRVVYALAMLVTPVSPACIGSAASGEAPGAAAGSIVLAPMPLPDDALYASRTSADRSGRVLAAVFVNDQGPFRFILDTGANTSAVSPSLVEELGLLAAPSLEVHGVTGMAMLPAVHVSGLRAGDIHLPSGSLPVLPGDIFGDADGILSLTAVAGLRVEVDFAHDRVTIQKSTGRPATQGYVVAKADLWQGGLLLISGRVGSIATAVIVDTGAERTLGNRALREAIVARSRPGDEFSTTVLGATAEVDAGSLFRVPRIFIGPARFNDLPVAFGDLYVFDIWALNDRPALVLGMDVLGRFERIAVDYRRREFQMRAWGNGSTGIRRCTPTTCGSRIRENGG